MAVKGGIDYIAAGGQTFGGGGVADRLLANDGHPCGLRPYIGRDRRAYQDRFLGNGPDGKPKYQRVLANAATLTYDEWKVLDRELVRAPRPKLGIWTALEGAGLGRTIPEGMAVTVLNYQSMTDAGNAQLDMDGVSEAERDRVQYDLRGLPMPIVHSDFSFTLREILQSRRFGTGIDTDMMEQSMRKCWELIEKLTMGTLSTFSYGGYTVYGFRNYPYRITKTFTIPTAAGWTPDTFISELLDALQSLSDIFFGGPFAVFVSPGWTKYMGSDYSAAYGGETLQTRMAKIGGISAPIKLDYLPNYEVLIVQLTGDVVRAVSGMNIVPVQWDAQGGLAVNFKLMGIKVPMLRRNSLDQTGVIHITAA